MDYRWLDEYMREKNTIMKDVISNIESDMSIEELHDIIIYYIVSSTLDKISKEEMYNHEISTILNKNYVEKDD